MPRARSRISASASLASSCALVTSSAASSWEPPSSSRRRARPRSTASETSRAWAPSCRSRSICRRSSLAEATARSRCSALRAAARSSSPRVGPSRARMSSPSKETIARMSHGVTRSRSAPPPTMTAHSQAASMRFPSQKTSPRLCSRDGEVPDRRADAPERHRPRDDGDQEAREAERKGEEDQVDERAPGRELEHRVDEPPEGPGGGRRRRRRLGDADPRSAAATSRCAEAAPRAAHMVSARSGRPTMKTIRLRLVVRSVRKMLNQATPRGSATSA